MASGTMEQPQSLPPSKARQDSRSSGYTVRDAMVLMGGVCDRRVGGMGEGEGGGVRTGYVKSSVEGVGRVTGRLDIYVVLDLASTHDTCACNGGR